MEWCRLAAAACLGILHAIDIHLEGRAVVGARYQIPAVGLEMRRGEAPSTGQHPLQDVTTRRAVLAKAEHVGFLLVLTLDREHTLDIAHVAELIGIDLELDGVVGQIHHLVVGEDVVGRSLLVVLQRVERDDARNLQENGARTLNHITAVAHNLLDGHGDDIGGSLDEGVGAEDFDLGCGRQGLALLDGHLAVLECDGRCRHRIVGRAMLGIISTHQSRIDGQAHGHRLGAAARGLDRHGISGGQFLNSETLHRHLLGTRDEQSHLLVIKLVALTVTSRKCQYRQQYNKIFHYSHNHK